MMRGLRPTWPSEFRLKQNPFDFDDGPGASIWTGFQEPRGSHSGEFHWAFKGHQVWDGCPQPLLPTLQFRSFDGSGNNLTDLDLNAAGTAVDRIGPAHFSDGISEPLDGPNPRTISNVVVGEGDANVPNEQGVSAFMYAWGQFIDHDLTLTRSDGTNDISIAVPNGDPVFGDGAIMPMTRAITDPSSGTSPDNPATPLNFSTGWLDASMVYGSNLATATSLRLPDGHMKVSEGGNLPIVNGMFAAGDPRAAENFALTSLHTLFVREHNYQVDKLHNAHPTWSGDQLYNYARAIVTAEIANITYEEFLPNLLGDDAIAPYGGYDASVDPRLSLEFNIAFRFGHSIVSAETESLAENGEVIEGTERELKDIFFAPPSDFVASGGADGQLRHLAGDPSQAMDVRIVEDLRNFLFDPPVSMDLAAINIQRERDFGVGSLNDVRESLGLARYTEIDQITSDPGTRAALKEAFSNNVDLIDLWTGGLAENHAAGALVGETFQTVIAMQFGALRDGDRFWFENQGFDAKTLQQIEQTTLADIILRNTDTQHIQDDVFIAYTRHTGLKGGVESEDPDERQLVIGSNGKDTLVGGPQGDFLFAGTGKQSLTGLGGADHFVFDKGGTRATITDFQPGVDKLEFKHAENLGWNDVRISSVQGNAIVSVGDDHIELIGVRPSAIHKYDFIFDV
ncbi:peroxidase family protein [Bradyrhizobium yuanmingense]|uniref:peroxidase family protein n=1 Tax=Bradyrhizobium yuanmingense TaxID=108015 RepID=UPI0012F7314E|nr:peroxidase family protein [Bradyrhizobium yuanmingense]